MGLYRRRNSVNAFRIAGRDGLYNYYWGNDLYASASWIKKRGRRVHDGRYHRVAATFDGWDQRIYVDFRVVRWRRTTGPVSLRYKKNFCIGKTYGREYFKGRMGDVRVYRWARAWDACGATDFATWMLRRATAKVGLTTRGVAHPWRRCNGTHPSHPSSWAWA